MSLLTLLWVGWQFMIVVIITYFLDVCGDTELTKVASGIRRNTELTKVASGIRHDFNSV